MVFSVSVPVLSVQITVAPPKASTIRIFFTIIPSLIIRHEPMAIKVVNATGISSGRIDIANVNPCNKLDKKFPDLQ